MEALQDDNGDGGMLCTEHPFKNNTPAGGICAFCLQEKLGKLVSSSFPIAVFPSSSSSSPSFRSDITVQTTTTTTTVAPPQLNSTSLITSNTSSDQCNYHHYYSTNNSNGSNKSRILYLLGQKKKKNKKDSVNVIDDRSKNMMFKRSKSTVTPRRGSGWHYTESDPSDNINSPHKQRGFWSFLYLQKHTQHQQKTLRDISSNSLCSSSVSSYPQAQRSKEMIVVEENESPCQASFDRKVSRSRSVGCGSRSFSGDFFERISTGFGDCTLRRVESQREGKSKVSGIRGGAGGGGGQDCIKERARCGGLFSGFMITSSSSSSSSSSYWANNNNNNNNNESSDLKMTSAVTSGQHQQHSRSKSWGWALASPMRAFSKPSKKEQAAATNKNQTPNLAAIPSLLSVRS